MYDDFMSTRIFTSTMNKISIWVPKFIRLMAMGTIYICYSSCTKCVLHILMRSGCNEISVWIAYVHLLFCFVFFKFSCIFYKIDKSLMPLLVNASAQRLKPLFSSLFCYFIKITICLFSTLGQIILMHRVLNANGCFTMLFIYVYEGWIP